MFFFLYLFCICLFVRLLDWFVLFDNLLDGFLGVLGVVSFGDLVCFVFGISSLLCFCFMFVVVCGFWGFMLLLEC